MDRNCPPKRLAHCLWAEYLPVIKVPQTVFTDWVYSRDTNETKLRGTAIFRNFDCSQMTGLKKYAAIKAIPSKVLQ